ncbi:hypothetical protein [Streptomyces sp. Da 82-17]|uniref:hypothetical protein n=1 Tax=Streptomyces sp. Da 82-17 TaxID=3377116 RepID=UPI0038D45DF9
MATSHAATENSRPPGCTCGATAAGEAGAEAAGIPVLADLLQALDRLKNDFEERLVDIAPTGREEEPKAYATSDPSDLLKPFADLRPARLGNSSRNHKKRFCARRLDISLDSFGGGVRVVRATEPTGTTGRAARAD